MIVPLPDPALGTWLCFKAFILCVKLFGKDASKVQRDILVNQAVLSHGFTLQSKMCVGSIQSVGD